MKKYITSFGGQVKGHNRHMDSYSLIRNYSAEVYRLFASAQPFGYEPLFYDDKWLLNSDHAKNPSTAKIIEENSYGWLQKPVVLKDALSKIEEGDYLIWADSNHLFSNPEPICQMCLNHPYKMYVKGHIAPYTNIEWCTKRMLQETNCDEIKYWYSHHLHCNVSAYIKTPFTVKFVNEWANWATNYDIMIKNDLPNYPAFREARHEQSLFSLLIEKYKIPYYPENEEYIVEMMGISI